MDIKLIWDRLYKSGIEMSFFQSFEWNAALETNFYRKKEHYKGHKLLYMVFNECLILPLVVDYRKKKICLLGQEEPSDYLSFIYAVYNPEAIAEAITVVLNKFPGYQLILDKINQNNPMTKKLQEGIDTISITEIEKECVCIPTKKEYASFYESLSKSTRQNYRTAKNRLKRDKCSYQVRIKTGKIDEKQSQRLLGLYKARRGDCDKRSKLIKVATKMLKTFFDRTFNSTPLDLLSYYSQREAVFLSEIYINGERAAFCEGNYNNRADVISIARVATNSKYYIYSPGQILLIETIENIRNEVEYLDLTRGSEDYKFKLGGIKHSNRCFTLEKS